jgi:hypothetical protein
MQYPLASSVYYALLIQHTLAVGWADERKPNISQLFHDSLGFLSSAQPTMPNIS